MIASPDRRSLALIQMMAAPLPGPPVQILRNGWFSAAGFFHNAQLGEIEEGGPGAAACEVAFYLPEGTPAKAWVACRADSKGGATIVARCAPANRYLEDEPVLAQITKTFREPARPAGGPPTPAAYPQDGVSYTRFTDPQAGTFTVDVPQGWDVRGGLNHFNLGDRRMFVEARSPEGILALYGDPDCPQSFYHTQMSFEGLPIPSATGCVFLNLPASSKKLTAYYLKNVAPKRLGAFRVIDERERPDIIQAALRHIQEMGIAIPRTLKMTTNEVRIEASGRIGSCLGASMCDTAHSFGLGEPWEGSVTIWLAPPHLANVAEQVARRMIDTFLPTPRLAQIVQQDQPGFFERTPARQQPSPLTRKNGIQHIQQPVAIRKNLVTCGCGVWRLHAASSRTPVGATHRQGPQGEVGAAPVHRR